MSAKAKLKLATAFLKEVGKIVSNETKIKIKEDLSRLEMLVNSYEGDGDNNIEAEKVAYMILRDVVKVCMERMDLYFGMNQNEEISDEKLSELIGDKRVYSKKELNGLIYKLISEEMITGMNINEFLQKYGIEESSEEQ